VKTILTAIFAIALVAFGVSTLRSCKLGKKYRDLKAAYETDRKIAEADHALSLSRIEELNNAIGQANNAIGLKEAEIAVKNAEILVLSNQLDELIGSEPPTTPEIESMPIVVSLRGQVRTLTEMYSLSQETITLQSKQIWLIVGQYNAQVLISAEWKSMYDNEHALRVNCEGLLKVCENRVSSPWKTARTVAYGVSAGFVIGSLISK
jgi:hypothetical protein